MLRIIVVIVVCAFIVSCAFIHKKGNGDLETSENVFSPFEKINVSGGNNIEVRFYAGDEYKTVLTVDSNLKEYLEIDTQNNTLYIKTKTERVYLFTQCLIEVYCPTLSALSISGSGSFKAADAVIAESFESKISGTGKIEGIFQCGTFVSEITGAGKIDGTVECDNFTARMSGTGNVTLSGSGNNADIIITGAGKVDGSEFSTNTASVSISGTGSVDIAVSDHLNASVNGAGKINYHGDPQIDFRNSGAGKVSKL